MKNRSDKDIISIGSAAKLLGVHVDTLRNWEKRGVITPETTVGGHRRYRISDIEKMIGDSMSDVLTKRWDKTGLLEGVVDKKKIAVCLDNQRVFNENNDLPAQFRRVSIPIVRRVLPTLNVSFASSLYIRGEEMEPHVTDVEWKVLSNLDLNAEARQTADVSALLKTYIEQMVSVGFVLNFKAFSLSEDNKILIYGLEA